MLYSIRILFQYSLLFYSAIYYFFAFHPEYFPGRNVLFCCSELTLQRKPRIKNRHPSSAYCVPRIGCPTRGSESRGSVSDKRGQSGEMAITFAILFSQSRMPPKHCVFLAYVMAWSNPQWKRFLFLLALDRKTHYSLCMCGEIVVFLCYARTHT